MATFAQRLDAYKWLFFEKGMQSAWTELKSMANAAVEAAPATYGAADQVTHMNPDQVSTFVDSGAERKIGAGASGAPNRQVLGIYQGFRAL